MDILAALEAAPTGRSGRSCKIQRWLDTIPEDAAGRDALVATFSTNDERAPEHRTLDQLIAVAARLGLETSIKTIGEHRSGRCRCFY